MVNYNYVWKKIRKTSLHTNLSTESIEMSLKGKELPVQFAIHVRTLFSEMFLEVYYFPRSRRKSHSDPKILSSIYFIDSFCSLRMQKIRMLQTII